MTCPVSPSAPQNKNSVSSRGWRSAPRDLTPAQALARYDRRVFCGSDMMAPLCDLIAAGGPSPSARLEMTRIHSFLKGSNTYFAATLSNHVIPVTAKLAVSSDASVAILLHPFHLTRYHIDLKRAIASNVSCPVLFGNGVVTRKQRNLKPALIIGMKGCHGAVFLGYEKFSIRERSRIRNTLSGRSAVNGTYRNHPFDARF